MNEPVPFGFDGRPEKATTDRVPMVVVPAELLKRCRDFLELFINDDETPPGTRLMCRQLDSDLADALSTV